MEKYIKEETEWLKKLEAEEKAYAAKMEALNEKNEKLDEKEELELFTFDDMMEEPYTVDPKMEELNEKAE